jgi:hypothetical protein
MGAAQDNDQDREVVAETSTVTVTVNEARTNVEFD